ncbi:hypothetical protein N8Z27_02040 [Crocinitomicaceae bacterium]|jgi:hypothetical protein|nr:hypothetical protein [Crocinitomicaceae bacterium]MDC0099293.1 hypothetical protein [Crocinitomicaceae bacterium]MDC1196010.1 hypothetical protein [Crocinitomicaceae bacterium]MDC1282941.1 hypothetical protein [Crocinitomicaceae bacterium]MDC1384842.1 hypothetical protein [Crocinitomicaceae bacterium]|tara:strand:+ start:78432 stop:78701 length:270 start_codon:yes stop_codon:yes gene_type:complete
MKSILLINTAFCTSQFNTKAQGASDSARLPVPKIAFTPITLVPEEISHFVSVASMLNFLEEMQQCKNGFKTIPYTHEEQNNLELKAVFT